MPVHEQGVTLDRYMLIPRVLIFLTRGNRVLLLKGAPTKRIWANKYNGVGGHVEPGEDVLTAAWRELLEETGLPVASIQTLRLCGTVVVNTEQNPGIGMYIFTGECVTGVPRASSARRAERSASMGLRSFQRIPSSHPIAEESAWCFSRMPSGRT